MRLQGRITRWDDARGYGQITWNGGGEPLFVHIKAFVPGARRPQVDDIVTYERGADASGRPRAERVDHARAPARSAARGAAPGRRSALPLGFTAAFVLVLLLAIWRERLPLVIGAAYAALSVVLFVLYGMDKAAAQAGDRRTPESTLQLLAMAGGWPGAVLAQRLLRHKSSKAEFQRTFRAAVVLNLIALGWLASSAGASLRESLSALL